MGSGAKYWAATTATFIAATLSIFLAAEVAARVDDFIFADVPILANPDRERDLLKREAWGMRGKPNGVYRKWKLNTFGFLGPEITLEPTGIRLMVLGASETFGLYESMGNDYPQLLARELKRRGWTNIEVINASIAGSTLPAITKFWQEWASQFRPHVVLIYPSSHFYLNTEMPRLTGPAAFIEPLQETTWKSRVLLRAVDQAKQLPVLRAIRVRYVLDRTIQGKELGDLFTASPPTERLAAFTNHLERLADAVESHKAVPVILTQAFKVPTKFDQKDLPELEYFRIFFPKASAEAFPAFVSAARNTTLELAQRRDWKVIDVAEALSGKRELFADPVHFNDHGSHRMAQIIADAITTTLESIRGRR